jgi:hypothetical protein
MRGSYHSKERKTSHEGPAKKGVRMLWPPPSALDYRAVPCPIGSTCDTGRAALGSHVLRPRDGQPWPPTRSGVPSSLYRATFIVALNCGP